MTFERTVSALIVAAIVVIFLIGYAADRAEKRDNGKQNVHCQARGMKPVISSNGSRFCVNDQNQVFWIER